MSRTALVTVIAASFAAQVALAADLDGDGIDATVDNCIEIANNQLDTDLDGYGDACDGDLNQDGTVDGLDFGAFASDRQRGFDTGIGADMNCDGVVDGLDFLAFGNQLARGYPGPSGLACAGEAPCALAPPKPALPIVQVRPVAGGLGQDAIDAALTACGSGCNLLFLADTYEGVAMEIGSFADGFAMYGYGMGRTILRAPLFDATSWAPTIYVTDDAPDGDAGDPGVIIQGITLDGRKHEQTPVANQDNRFDARVWGMGILTGRPPGGYLPILRSHGHIREVEVRHYVEEGIVAYSSPSWIIEDSYIHHIGCHQVNEPCGCALADEPCEDLGWNDLADAEPGLPDKKAAGVGIVAVNRNHDIVVRNNRLHDITKMGISVFGDGGAGCTDLVATHGALIQDNEVWDSQTGFANNGGCGTTFDRNYAHDLEAPNAGQAYTGKGFACGGNGEGSVWMNNTAERAHGPGFDIGCTDGNLTFQNNVSRDNCRGAAFHDLAFHGPSSNRADWVSSVYIESPFSDSPLCAWGMLISKRSWVNVAGGGSITGGSRGGIQIRGVHHVEIEDVRVSSGSGASHDIGVYLDYTQPVDPGVAPLSEVYIQPTTVVTGFDANEVTFSPGHSLGDDDGVAYCGDEPSPPAGCDNAR